MGDFFGSFLEYDPNNNSSIWRECMRVKIKIDVRKPLKRKKIICRKNGVENIIQCKYERLGDFCFTCGMVTHTERFCNMRSSMAQTDLIREWGSGLRAPARRLAGQERSKWLRDERDIDWGVNHGSSNYSQHFSGSVTKVVERKKISRSDFRANNKALGTGSSSQLDISKIVEANNNFKSIIGPTEQELHGLNIEERKRRRGPGVTEFMDIEDTNRLHQSGAALSNVDCATSSPELLAKLVMQASQSR